MKKAIFAMLAVAGATTAASADDLILVDLSVTNQITITSTAGLSAATVSGTDNIGVYFEDFFGTNSLGSAGSTLVPGGNIRPVGTTTDGSPSLFHFTSDPGLNLFSWTNDATSSFTAGSQAFTGAATYNLTAAAYAAYTANNPIGRTGNLWFEADNLADLPNASVIGTYRVVPVPGVMSLFGVGLIAAARRRR